jgi:hypothetical protein
MTERSASTELKREIKDEFAVSIFNEDDGTDVKIGANGGTRIGEVIDEMYDDFGLKHDSKDRLRCANERGIDVFQFRTLTMREYLQKGHCPRLHWKFAAETGGA